MAFVVTTGLGAVAATVDPVGNSNVVAQAEAVTYTVNALTAVASSSATLIEAYPNDGSGKPAGNWKDRYTLVEDTGTGFCLNGEKLATYSIKQPNDFYIELGVEAKAGDIVTIDGTFYNVEYYNRFANVNKELNAISAVYASFNWKGVILGAGKDNGSIFSSDDDYEAYNLVKGQIGVYELTASDTKHLASVSTNKTN